MKKTCKKDMFKKTDKAVMDYFKTNQKVILDMKELE